MFVRLCGAALALMLLVLPSYAEKLSLHVALARAIFDPQTSKPVVWVFLEAEGARAFAQFTQANPEHPARLSVNGKVLMASAIQKRTNVVQLSGAFGLTEAIDLADTLSAGNTTIEVEPAE